MIYKTPDKNIEHTEQHETHRYQDLISGAPERLAVPTPHVTPVVLLLIRE